MTFQLVEGQNFSANYTLLQRIAQREAFEVWLGLDRVSSERVILRIFRTPLGQERRARIESAIAASRGLIHPNIARIYGLEQTEGVDYIVCQYVRGGRPFVPEQVNFAAQWSLVAQLFDTLAFAHNLGMAHGHVHPANLLVDDQGNLYLTDFGLPTDPQGESGYRNWLSPQVRQGAAPDRSDDIYSLGYLIYLGLTGRQWREDHGFETNSPVPEEVRHLVTSMLAGSAWERPRDLSHARDVIRRYVLGESDVPLESLGDYFSRPAPRDDAQYSRPSHTPLRESRVMSAPVAFAGFALLVVLAGIVFFLLPKTADMPPNNKPAATNAPQATQTAAAQQQPGRPELTPLQIAKLEQLKKEGNDVATKLLQLQVGLEDLGVQLWAPDKYKSVQDVSAKGDDAYRNGDYQQALDLYNKAVATLQGLKSQVAAVKQKNLDAGKAAFSNGDYQGAIKAYTIVNAIDPGDQGVKHQLTRAKNLQQVLALIKVGESLEGEGKFDDARIKFAAAYKLDPEWHPAKQDLERIDARIAKRKFDDAMSVAFTALGNKQYEKSRAAFEQARKILPHSTEPADGLQQVDIAIRQDKIEAQREHANADIKAEDWHGAVAAYQKILALDPTLVFANDGLDRAKSRLELQRQMHHYINQPSLMASDDELTAARKLMVRAANATTTGPKLQTQMDKLSQLIALARIPVPLKLKSDNQTDVTIYRVGHFGKLESTSVKLVPGQYTIVGRRDGYRDVQRQITVIGGEEPEPVYISCTHKI